MQSDRKLVPSRVAKRHTCGGTLLAGNRPFRVPLAFESQTAVNRAHRKLMTKFNEHICNEDADRAAKAVASTGKRHASSSRWKVR